MGCKFLGADTIVLGASGRCPATLPGEPESDRLPVFRQPRVVNASANQNVIATGSNGADFVVFVRQHDGIEDVSIRIGDGHHCICVPGTGRVSVFRAPLRTVSYSTKLTLPAPATPMQSVTRDFKFFSLKTNTLVNRAPFRRCIV